MPTRLGSLVRHISALARGAVPRGWSPPVDSTARWSTDTARAWHDTTGWLVGRNFVPSTAGNQLEMWQPATFDPETVDRELGWAADLGMNSARVFLHDLLWLHEGDQLRDRVEEFLTIADGHGIATMPVLFDGVWDPQPRLGPQREPTPGRHNTIWVQSPGAVVLADDRRWPALRPCVEAVLTRFDNDDRVVVWDLFNEPDQPNAISYPHKEVSKKSKRVHRLLDAVSFHSYSPRRRLEQAIDHLSAYGRPMLCTEWLGRSLGSTANLLEVFAERRVGAWSWGLVDGRSQTRFPWTSWIRPNPDDDTWFHDLLHPDGSPYEPDEVSLFRQITRAER